ncbi:MAG: methyltransferase domain-containing protein [Actinomycetota bacterium]|nr:methyltransferase domain-containing protein [Actinomycetota bacterium]
MHPPAALRRARRALRPAMVWAMGRSPAVRRRLWPLLSHRSAFVHRYLNGLEGVEVGASAHNDYGLDAINVDRYASMDTVFKEEEWKLCGRKRTVDVVAPGDQLPFADDSHDFVFASHVIEHFPDPIRALEEWLRVARRYVVLVVPHRDRTFDRDREVTPVEELVRRHEEGFSASEDAHWTVWTLESFLAMCDHFGFRVVDHLDPDDKNGNGFIVVLDASRRT